MTTRLQKLSAAVHQLGSDIKARLDAPKEDMEGLSQAASQLYDPQPEVQKLASKAGEKDPEKRVYGPAMVAKARNSATISWNASLHLSGSVQTIRQLWEESFWDGNHK